MSGARRAGLVAAVAGVAGALAAPALAAPSTGTARLQGQFLMNGRITVAVDVRGEHVGQKIQRRWTFISGCTGGQCTSVELIRQRSGGSDRLVLTRRAPGSYAGRGSFYAPLRCGSHMWRRGERVPFTITVQITAANSAGLASQVTATYNNPRRINRTPCVLPLLHDAARYRGHLLST